MDQYLDAGNFTQKISGYICGAVSQYLRKVTLAINNRALPCSRSNNLFHGFNKQFIFFAEKHKWASTRVHKKTYFAICQGYQCHSNLFRTYQVWSLIKYYYEIVTPLNEKCEPYFFLSFQNQIFSSTTWQVGEGGQGGAGGDCELCHADCSNNSPLWKYSALEISTTGKTYNSLQ